MASMKFLTKNQMILIRIMDLKVYDAKEEKEEKGRKRNIKISFLHWEKIVNNYIIY